MVFRGRIVTRHGPDDVSYFKALYLSTRADLEGTVSNKGAWEQLTSAVTSVLHETQHENIFIEGSEEHNGPHRP